MGEKYYVCYKAFQSVYDITKYKRKVLLSEVKNGIRNSDKEFTDWGRVHDSTLETVSAFLKNDDNELGFTAKEIIANISCPNTAKTHKVSDIIIIIIIINTIILIIIIYIYNNALY